MAKAKHEAAQQPVGSHWKPLQSRFKIELIKESLSTIIIVDRPKGETYVKARIIDMGPQCGYDKFVVGETLVKGGSVVSQVKVHDFNIGDVLIVNKGHIAEYIEEKPAADGTKVKHLFLKDETGILAVETPGPAPSV